MPDDLHFQENPLQWERTGDIVTIRIDGMGLVRDDSRAVMARAMEANPGCDLVLSCREIRYISSSSFGVLLYARSLLEKQGRRLVIVSDEPSVLETVCATRLDQVLRIAPDEETARELLAAQPGVGSPPSDRSAR